MRPLDFSSPFKRNFVTLDSTFCSATSLPIDYGSKPSGNLTSLCVFIASEMTETSAPQHNLNGVIGEWVIQKWHIGKWMSLTEWGNW